MDESRRRRLLWVLGAIVAVAVVAAVAYTFGASHPGDMYFGPGYRMFGYYGGFGLFGLLGPLLMIFLVILLFAWLMTPSGSRRSGSPPYPPYPPQNAGGVDELVRLADLHDRGKLTDEEFEIAKRRLLGM